MNDPADPRNPTGLPVYHVVNGERVPKPGNQLSPGRRYGHVADFEKGQYLLEFTDAEEAQRDEEERKWEAERPAREAKVAEERAAAEAYRATLHYDNRVVAFVDVLGWGDAVARSVADPELIKTLGLALTAMEGQGKMFDFMRAQFPDSAQLSQFSDSIIISAAPTVEGFSQVLHALSFLRGVFPRSGLWLRGGITMGLAYHRNSIAFGPAIAEAYDLESRRAGAPRIILSNSAIAWLAKHGRPLLSRPAWRRHWDQEWFMDFLQPLTGRTFLDVEKPSEQSINLARLHFETIRKPIAHGLATFAEHRTKAKYLWLASYFNVLLAEYPEVKVEPFQLP
jgi:hypothetical protein